MKILLQELELVSELAPKGSHVKVAKENHISAEYLYQIRAGKNMKTDSIENRQTLQSLIDSYRGILREIQSQLTAIL